MLPLAFTMGGPELLVILVIALLIFGTRLPALMRSAGQSVNSFKQGLADDLEPVAEAPVQVQVQVEAPRHHA